MKLKMATPSLNSEWVPPAELPDLTEAKTIAIDVETRDPNIKTLTWSLGASCGTLGEGGGYCFLECRPWRPPKSDCSKAS